MAMLDNHHDTNAASLCLLLSFSTVKISCYSKHDGLESRNLGTGFIVHVGKKHSIIFTCSHIFHSDCAPHHLTLEELKLRTTIKIWFFNQCCDAELLLCSSDFDFTIIMVETHEKFQSLNFREEEVTQGMEIYCLSNPCFDSSDVSYHTTTLDNTFSIGYIQSPTQEIDHDLYLKTQYVQYSLPGVALGSSGAATLDSNGLVFSIMTNGSTEGTHHFGIDVFSIKSVLLEIFPTLKKTMSLQVMIDTFAKKNLKSSLKRPRNQGLYLSQQGRIDYFDHNYDDRKYSIRQNLVSATVGIRIEAHGGTSSPSIGTGFFVSVGDEWSVIFSCSSIFDDFFPLDDCSFDTISNNSNIRISFFDKDFKAEVMFCSELFNFSILRVKTYDRFRTLRFRDQITTPGMRAFSVSNPCQDENDEYFDSGYKILDDTFSSGFVHFPNRYIRFGKYIASPHVQCHLDGIRKGSSGAPIVDSNEQVSAIRSFCVEGESAQFGLDIETLKQVFIENFDIKDKKKHIQDMIDEIVAKIQARK